MYRLSLRLFTSLFFLTNLCFSALSQQLMRQPSLSPNGESIAFGFQGDLWTVSSMGGRAQRLTIHPAYEGMPMYSRDGQWIAFSGNRYGNSDLFVMPALGGNAQRLTHHSANDVLASWTPDQKLLFSTSREYRQIERPLEVYQISAQGGTEERVLDALGFEPQVSPNGRFIAFVRGDINPVYRKDYRGSSNRELWIFDQQKKQFHALPGFETNDVQPQWKDDKHLVFLSSESGTYNVYELALDADAKAIAKPKALTRFKSEDIRHFSVSANGQWMVLERGMELYRMKSDGSAITQVKVEIAADERLDPFETKNFSQGAEQFNVSPNGKFMAFTLRGEIFIKENNKDRPRAINASKHAFRDQQPVFLNDSTLIFASDRQGGNFDFYLYRSKDSSTKSWTKSLKNELLTWVQSPEDESSLVPSPDGKKVVFVRGRGKLILADLGPKAQLQNERVLLDSWAAPTGISWSPDGRYLAYAQRDLYFNEEVFILPLSPKAKPVNVSMHPRGDGNPVWTPDGSKLAFISDRGTAKNQDIWFVWLKKSDFEKSQQDWLEEDKPESSGPARPNEKKAGPKPIEIDFEGIYERVVRVTNTLGEESQLQVSKDGETFYFSSQSGIGRGRELYSIKWDGKDLKELSKGISNPQQLAMDKEGKYLYVLRAGSFARLDPKTSAPPEALAFQTSLRIDYRAEREQVFEEAWRTIRDGFYDPQWHGYDWNKLKAQYKDKCLQASTASDFRDMFNWLLGELNASHMGLTVPERTETQRELTGLIGAELRPSAQGMVVSKVIPGSPAAQEKSRLEPGDLIVSVNEQAYDPKQNFYGQFNGKVGERVLLEVQNAKGQRREVNIRLVANLTEDLYQAWVDQRKALVEKYSNGRIGYIHIKGMDFPSFETVEREFTAAGYGKEALVIDVRYNGGGSTTDYLMTILNYKQHAYTIPRGASNDLEKDKGKFRDYYPIGERLVYAAWTKPSIALCNEGSYSNAEIFSHAYQSLGIGKLVGLPTNGSVISTGGKSLMDGSFVRLPGRGWFTKKTDKNQELGAAVPDVLVNNSPDWISKGEDAQLKTAVELLLKDLR